MTDSVTMRLVDAPVIERLRHISSQIDDLSPALRGIGEIVSESTKERFATSIGPGGERWAANAPSTVLARLAQISGAYGKSGKITKKGIAAAQAKRPLVATGELRDSIHYQLGADGKSVMIGTNRFSGEWDGGAAVHQFGSKDGRIPARPFLGISLDDRHEVLTVLTRFAQMAIEK